MSLRSCTGYSSHSWSAWSEPIGNYVQRRHCKHSTCNLIEERRLDEK